MKTCRILHVVGRMRRAGIETWLMQVLRRIDRARYQMDFLTVFAEPGEYDQEIRALGARIIPCLHPRRPWQFAWNFRNVLRRYGPYDVIHCHVDHYNGFPLRLARQWGVPRRIAHSHNDNSLSQQRAHLARKAYFRLMNHWIHDNATDCLGASRKAAAAMFGPEWHRDRRCRVLYCGIDLQPFRAAVDSQALRHKLGLPPHARVIGHVGRFQEQKNHTFLVDIAAELVRLDPRARFLLVGEGPLRSQIEEKVNRLSLSPYFVFAGSRPDVSQLMLGAMDAFVFPSLFEGLGLVLIEAQAAGLPCIIPHDLPEEADVIPGLVHRLPLTLSAAAWAKAVHEVERHIPSLVLLANGPFDIDTSLKELENIYNGPNHPNHSNLVAHALVRAASALPPTLGELTERTEPRP